MPIYDYACQRCDAKWEEIHTMAACDEQHPCPMCRSIQTGRIITQAVAIKGPPDSGWEYENGGRGRRISQLAKDPNDMSCCFRSQRDAIDAAKAQGCLVVDKL